MGLLTHGSFDQISRATAAGIQTVRQFIPAERAVVITGATIRATTAGRIPRNIAATTGWFSMRSGVRKMAITSIMAKLGRIAPSEAAATSHAVADCGGEIHCEYARESLCDGQEVEKLLTAEPPFRRHHLSLDQRNHCPPSAECKCPDAGEGGGELAEKFHSFGCHSVVVLEELILFVKMIVACQRGDETGYLSHGVAGCLGCLFTLQTHHEHPV